MPALHAFNTGRFARQEDEDDEYIDLTSSPLEERLRVLDNAPVDTPITLYGYYLRVAAEHVRPSVLENSWRTEGDRLADDAVMALSLTRQTADAAAATCPLSASPSVEALQSLRGSSPAIDAFLRSCEAIPSSSSVPPSSSPPPTSSYQTPTSSFTVNWDKVRRGQTVYAANFGCAGVVLMNLSLIGGFGASRINKVLEGTGYLSSGRRDLVHRRLLETLQFVVDVLEGGPETLMPGGRGWKACVNVRIMHSAVRLRLLQGRREEAGSGSGGGSARGSPPSSAQHWDTTAWGVPVNQEDLLTTQLAFSLVVLMGMERAGLAWHLSDDDCDCVIHHWALVGHLMGVDPSKNALATAGGFRSAQRMLESTVSHIAHADESSRRLVWSCLKGVAYRLPFGWSVRDHVAVTRMLAGHWYADAIGIPSAGDPHLDDEVVEEEWEADEEEDGVGGGGGGTAPRPRPGSVLASGATSLPGERCVVVERTGGDGRRVLRAIALPPSFLGPIPRDENDAFARSPQAGHRPSPVRRVLAASLRAAAWGIMALTDAVGWAFTPVRMVTSWWWKILTSSSSSSSREEEEEDPMYGRGQALLRPLRLLPWVLSIPLPYVYETMAQVQIAHIRAMLQVRMGKRTEYRVRAFPAPRG